MGALDFGELRLDDGVVRLWDGTEWKLLTDLISGGGGATAVSYVHNQATPASTWIVTHNLGWYPNVTVIDSAGTEVEGDITHLSLNQLRLMFSGGFAGTAYLS